jgi:hypothetical protein
VPERRRDFKASPLLPELGSQPSSITSKLELARKRRPARRQTVSASRASNRGIRSGCYSGDVKIATACIESQRSQPEPALWRGLTVCKMTPPADRSRLPSKANAEMVHSDERSMGSVEPRPSAAPTAWLERQSMAALKPSGLQANKVAPGRAIKGHGIRLAAVEMSNEIKLARCVARADMPREKEMQYRSHQPRRARGTTTLVLRRLDESSATNVRTRIPGPVRSIAHRRREPAARTDLVMMRASSGTPDGDRSSADGDRRRRSCWSGRAAAGGGDNSAGQSSRPDNKHYRQQLVFG